MMKMMYVYGLAPDTLAAFIFGYGEIVEQCNPPVQNKYCKSEKIAPLTENGVDFHIALVALF